MSYKDETVEGLERQLVQTMTNGESAAEVADFAVRAVWKLLFLCRSLRTENDDLRSGSAKAA